MIENNIIFFILGLQSTLHCVGMCGPLAMAAPINKKSTSKAIIGSLSYNFGRLTSYIYLGFIVGILGIQSWMLHSFQWISILTGVIMLATLLIGSIETWPVFRFITAWFGKLTSQLFPQIKKAPAASQSYLFGLLNGLLPCGMVYIALLYSLSIPSMASATLGMLFFGLGTLPVMFFIPLMKKGNLLGKYTRLFHKALLMIIGILLLIRGLGLGIPFLSPEIKSPLHKHQQPSIECCKVH
ncbi:MAG: sulfite exporter TauE/SafE family protein [Flavobacteriales bacterium]